MRRYADAGAPFSPPPPDISRRCLMPPRHRAAPPRRFRRLIASLLHARCRCCRRRSAAATRLLIRHAAAPMPADARQPEPPYASRYLSCRTPLYAQPFVAPEMIASAMPPDAPFRFAERHYFHTRHRRDCRLITQMLFRYRHIFAPCRRWRYAGEHRRRRFCAALLSMLPRRFICADAKMPLALPADCRHAAACHAAIAAHILSRRRRRCAAAIPLSAQQLPIRRRPASMTAPSLHAFRRFDYRLMMPATPRVRFVSPPQPD